MQEYGFGGIILEKLNAKRISESYTEQVQILTQANLNGYSRLFGGQLMEWIDVVAAVVARRHSGKNVTTAMVDSLEFEGPAHGNDTLLLAGKMTYAGRTSMEVKVQSFVEELDGSKRLINTAYIVLVALDDNERPVEVPPLIVETEEEKAEWERAKKRRKLRETRRNENQAQC